MLGDVIEAAAELADTAEPTVTAALDRYQLIDPVGRDAQIWVSVAFLLDRNAKLAAALPGGS